MANTKEYKIVINGLTESIKAVDSLNKQLDGLEQRMNKISSSKSSVSSGGSSKGKSTLSDEEMAQREINKLKEEGQRLDAKIAATQDEIFKRVDATKQLYKETLADQKAIAAQERLTANAYSNTMQGMKAQLADLKAVIQTTDIGDNDQIKKMTEQANELTKKLKEMEEAYGAFGRNVGNYASAAEGFNKLRIEVGDTVREFNSAKEASKTFKNELYALELQGKSDTKEADNLRQALYKLQSAMDDATKSSRAMDEAMDFMQSFTAMASVGNGLQAFFGFDDNEITKSIQKLVALQGVLNGLETLRKQMETGEGIGKILGKGFKDIDKLTYSLQRANVALRGTGTSAKIAAVGIKALNYALKGLMTLGIGVAIDLIVEGIQKLVGVTKNWAKGDADLVSASEVLEKNLESQNRVLEKNIELIKKANDSGVISDTQAKAMYELEYAKALNEVNKVLKEREDLIRNQGIKGNSELYLQSGIGDKGVTTFAGFSTAIKDINDFTKRWDYLNKRVVEGKDLFDSFFMGIMSTASDAKDEFNHLNKIIANDFINAFYKMADGTREGSKALVEYIRHMDELTNGRYSRGMELVKVDNEALQKELDNAWAMIQNLRDNVWKNPIVVKIELNNKIEQELDRLDPTRVAQRTIDEWTEILVFGIDEAGNKLTEAQRKNIEKIIKEEKKNLKKQKDQRLKAEKDNAKKLAQEADRVDKEIRKLRIENMKEGLDKELAQLKEERRIKLKEAKETGIRVEEQRKLINELYRKKEEEATRKHAAEVEQIYRGMWEQIYRTYDQTFRMNSDTDLDRLETKLKKNIEDLTKLGAGVFNSRYASYGGIQFDNLASDKLKRSLGFDYAAKGQGSFDEGSFSDAKKYLDILEEIEAIELKIKNIDDDFDLNGPGIEELEEQLEKAKKSLEEFDERIDDSVYVAELRDNGYTKSLSNAYTIRINEARNYYSEVTRLEKEYYENVKKNELDLLKNESNTAEREESSRFSAQLAQLEESREKGLMIEKDYNELVERAYLEHANALEAIQLRFVSESERIEQQYQDNIKASVEKGMRGMLNEYRDAYDNISKLQSRQPQKMSGFLGGLGIVNFKLSKENYEEALDAYRELSNDILNEKKKLQEKLDNNEITFDDFQQAKRELDGLSQDVVDAATEIEEKSKNLVGEVIASINNVTQQLGQSIMQIYQSIWDAQDVAFEKEQEKLDKWNEKLDKALDKQQEIVEEHKNNIDSIEDELADARGSRRQHLIDQLNAEIEAQRDARREEKRIQKEKEAAEKKQEQLDKKRKKEEYERNVKQAFISWHLAIANGLATQPFLYMGIAMGALATVLGGIQYALVKSQKPYAKGGQLDGNSGLAQGPRHRDGGIPVLGGRASIEGGEFITNRTTTAKNLDLLEYINSKKKKVDMSDLIEFYSGGNTKKAITGIRTKFEDGGYMPTLPNTLDIKDQLQNVVINQDNRPIYVSVVDINNKQDDVRRVQTLAGLE